MILDFSFKQVMKLSSIKRWAIIDMSREQSVAEHSYNVTMITMGILSVLDCNMIISAQCKEVALKWAMCHDLTELVTGDFPSSLKEHFGKDISVMEKNCFPLHYYMKQEAGHYEIPYMVVKVADLMDAIQFAQRFCVDEKKDAVIGDMQKKLRSVLTPSDNGSDQGIKSLVHDLIMQMAPEIWNA